MEQTKFPAVTNMVLFSKPVALTKQKLEAAAQAHGVQNFSVTSQEGQEGQEGSFVVFWEGRPFIVMSMEAPVPADTFDGVLQFSFGLDNAEQIVSKQKAHVIISPLAETANMGQGIMNAVGVTELSAVVAKILKPLGHYWSHADTLISFKQFASQLNELRKAMSMQRSGGKSGGAHLPKYMWVGFRLIGGEQNGSVGARTIGLEAFTGFELEIVPVQIPMEALGQRIYGIIEYIFCKGPVLKDGQTLGANEEEVFRLLWKPAM